MLVAGQILAMAVMVVKVLHDGKALFETEIMTSVSSWRKRGVGRKREMGPIAEAGRPIGEKVETESPNNVSLAARNTIGTHAVLSNLAKTSSWIGYGMKR